jgi:hypothetical protein
MASDLRTRAATAAAGTTGSAPVGPDRPDITTAPLEAIEYTGEILDAAQVPVHIAWARVMADVQSISKADRRDDTGGRYNFRGVDRVINAVGPALRRHGVLVLPKDPGAEYRDTRTANNKPMRECVVTVQWTVRGPRGDDLPPLESIGEATDTQDKATAKAVSVAQRVLFLAALQIPTQDPDIDRGHERGEAPMPKPTDWRDEITDPRTSLGRLKQIKAELGQHRMGKIIAVNEVGDEEQLIDMVNRIGKQRTEAGER